MTDVSTMADVDILLKASTLSLVSFYYYARNLRNQKNDVALEDGGCYRLIAIEPTTGDSYRSLHFLFKISSAAISIIVHEVCNDINTVLKDQVKLPQTANEWLAIEMGFNRKFPHCVGCIDGKHVVMRSPTKSGSEYHNYKGTFSIVLLALVDSDYRFIFADIGAQGRISDGGVIQNSILCEKINNGTINLPLNRPLPGRQYNVPYVFLGDGAFALSNHVMKPFRGNHALGSLQRTYNQRLSSTRVIVEKVFGVLTSVFRIFKKPMEIEKDRAVLITMTCILLHNFLRNSRSSRNIYTPPGTFDTIDNDVTHEGSCRRNQSMDSAIRPLQTVGRRAPRTAEDVRIEFATFFQNSRYIVRYKYLIKVSYVVQGQSTC